MASLHNLVRRNDVERLVEALVELADPNSRTANWLTPLHILASKEARNNEEIEIDLEMARQLKHFGADVNLTDHNAESALMKAAYRKNYRMVEFLLESNAQINARDVNGLCALHHAIMENVILGLRTRQMAFLTIQTLLRFNPNLKFEGFYRLNDYWLRSPPFLQAVYFNNLEIVQEFLKRYSLEEMLINPEDAGRALHIAFVHRNGAALTVELLRHGFEFDEGTISTYISSLKRESFVVAEESKYKFKLYCFASSEEFDENLLNSIIYARTCKLSKFVGICKREIKQMKEDEVAPGLSVFDMARRGFRYKSLAGEHVPLEALDATLVRLKRGQYPVYCDFILPSICSPYMNNKFAEALSKVYFSDKISLPNESYYDISFYLSHLDMLNTIRACDPEPLPISISSQQETWSTWFRRLNPISHCTVM